VHTGIQIPTTGTAALDTRVRGYDVSLIAEVRAKAKFYLIIKGFFLEVIGPISDADSGPL
jgi:hypothetical protein